MTIEAKTRDLLALAQTRDLLVFVLRVFVAVKAS